MKIHINASTPFVEYKWYSEETVLPDDCTLGGFDSASCYALIAGKRGRNWYVDFVNLWTGDTDTMGRPCRLSIRFDELESEAQVRALALAYLDIPLENVTSRKAYRHSKELAACYVIEDETLKFDFDRARQWACHVIESTEFSDETVEAQNRLECRINHGEWSVREVVERLQTTKLQDKQGVRLLWTNTHMDEKSQPDIVILVEDGPRRIRKRPILEDKQEFEQGNRDKEIRNTPKLELDGGVRVIRGITLDFWEKGRQFYDEKMEAFSLRESGRNANHAVSTQSQLANDFRQAWKSLCQNKELMQQIRLAIGVERYERIEMFMKRLFDR